MWFGDVSKSTGLSFHYYLSRKKKGYKASLRFFLTLLADSLDSINETLKQESECYIKIISNTYNHPKHYKFYGHTRTPQLGTVYNVPNVQCS